MKTTMMIIMVIHIFLAILKMFVLSPFSAFGDLISCMILYCGTAQVDFCPVLLYMIFCLFDAFQLFVMIGFMVQTGNFYINGVNPEIS